MKSLTTLQTTFDPCLVHDDHMYAVRPGVTMRQALWNAGALLESAKVIAEQIPAAKELDRERLGYACAKMIEFARAAVEACNSALEEDERKARDDQ